MRMVGALLLFLACQREEAARRVYYCEPPEVLGARACARFDFRDGTVTQPRAVCAWSRYLAKPVCWASLQDCETMREPAELGPCYSTTPDQEEDGFRLLSDDRGP